MIVRNARTAPSLAMQYRLRDGRRHAPVWRTERRLLTLATGVALVGAMGLIGV